MIFKNYYKLLDLPQNTKSTQEQIKIAYRTQAKKYHPDVNIQNKSAEERFKDISEAYKILSDASQKKKYDRMWNNYVGKKIQKEKSSQNEVGANDIVNMFFGGSVQKNNGKAIETSPTKGENIETRIDLSIKEAFEGTTKKISLAAIGEKNKNFSIIVPAGVKSGDRIRVKGRGKKGKNGGENGDLVIKIDIKDNEIYQLVENDINVKLYLTPWDAALGTKVNVNGIDGQVAVLIPKGTQNGDKISIPNKGYYGKDKQRGNLVVKTEIAIPKQLTEDEKKLFAELRKRSKFNPKQIG